MINLDYKSNPCSHAPSVIVTQTTEGLKGLADAFVYVTSINTVFFVSSCHEITVISSGPVYVDNYNAATNPLGLANQVCYDFAGNVGYAFNAAGDYRVFDLKEVN